ncbi:MAG: hypothetical protein ABSH28_12390 [Acidobacteriota bacterium]|jgi:hypothetical protein
MFKKISVKVILSAIGLLLIGPGIAHCQTAKAAVRIGTYDSRAIAIAYYNSGQPAQAQVRGLQAEYAKAKAANDDKSAKELEAAGIAWQELMHEQAFSTGSISNIIAAIKDKLPAIAQEAGVALLASKWDMTYRDASVEYVDVTMSLVKLFNPGEKVMKWIEELKTQDPVPIDSLQRGVMK